MIWIRWYMQEARRLLGWSGIAGVLLALGAAYLHLNVTAPMEARVAGLKAGMPDAYDRKRESVHRAAVDDPSAQLAAYYRHFASDEPLTDWLGRIYGIGESHRISLRQAEYRIGSERGSRLVQYQIAVPVNATYPQLKQFIAAVLAEAPLVALEQVTLQRRKVGEATIDAQLQFTLFLAEKS